MDTVLTIISDILFSPDLVLVLVFSCLQSGRGSVFLAGWQAHMQWTRATRGNVDCSFWTVTDIILNVTLLS